MVAVTREPFSSESTVSGGHTELGAAVDRRPPVVPMDGSTLPGCRRPVGGGRRAAGVGRRQTAEVTVTAVLFDLGGVLAVPGDGSALAAWAAGHGLGTDEVLAHQRTAIGPVWEGGRTISDIHARLAAACGIEVDELPALLAALHDEVLDKRLVAFLRSLRPRHRTGIVANNGDDARRWVIERLGLSDLVDTVVISAEEGVAKPAPEIYLGAARRQGVAPTACVFVDDTAACVEGAAAVGMTAVRHRSTDVTLAELRGILGVEEHDYEAAGGVVLDGDHVLVLERPSRGELRLPKGHVEPGETVQDAAVREVGEESGCVDVVVEAALGAQRVEFDTFLLEGAGHHVVRRERYFRMRLVSDRQGERDTADHKFVPRWLPIQHAVVELSFDNEREWLRRALTHERAPG